MNIPRGRRRTDSLVLILLFSIGLACAGLLLNHVRWELSFDDYLGESVYRVVLDGKIGGQSLQGPMSPAPMASLLQEQSTAVKSTTRVVAPPTDVTVSIGEEKFFDDDFFYVDPSFIQLLSISTLEGDAVQSLETPGFLVLTEETALRYFGSSSAVGKSLQFGGFATYEVGAVIRTPPRESNLLFDGLLSSAEVPFVSQNNWVANNVITYVELERAGATEDVTDIVDDINSIVSPELALAVETAYGLSFADFSKDNYFRYSLQPVGDIRTGPQYDHDYANKVDSDILFTLGAVGFAVLLMSLLVSCLFAFGSTQRRRMELFIRKLCGANPFAEFLSIYVPLLGVFVVSAGIAALLVVISFSTLRDLFQLEYGVLQVLSASNATAVLFYCILATILAATYSYSGVKSISPIDYLMARRPRLRMPLMRRGLVFVLYFLTSAVVVLSVIVMSQSLFIDHHDWGMEAKKTFVVSNTAPLRDQIEGFTESLRADDHVAAASVVSAVPGRFNSSIEYSYENAATTSKQRLRVAFVDIDYFDALGLDIIGGRIDDVSISNEKSAVVVNESAARLLDETGSVIGNRLIGLSPLTNEQSKSYEIVATVSDFHVEPLTEQIPPMALVIVRGYAFNDVLLRMNGNASQAEAEALVRSIAQRYGNGSTLTTHALTSIITEGTTDSTRIISMLLAFSLLAMLYGVVAQFAVLATDVRSRDRELSIRWILGATRKGLLLEAVRVDIAMFSVATILGLIPGVYLGKGWLAQYAYQHAEMISSIATSMMVGTAMVGVVSLFVFIQIGRQSIVQVLSDH